MISSVAKRWNNNEELVSKPVHGGRGTPVRSQSTYLRWGQDSASVSELSLRELCNHSMYPASTFSAVSCRSLACRVHGGLACTRRTIENHERRHKYPPWPCLGSPRLIMASPKLNTMARWNFTWAVGSKGCFSQRELNHCWTRFLYGIPAHSRSLSACAHWDGKQGKIQGSKTLCKGRIPPVRE